MIGRRAFTLGLAAAAFAGRAATAQERGDRHGLAGQTRKLRDIPYTPLDQIPNHRQLMRDIVTELSTYAKGRDPNFILLARNAPELLIKERREWDWESGRDVEGAAIGKYPPIGSVIRPYLKAIDGILADGPFCGFDRVDQLTDEAAAKPLLDAIQLLSQEGRRSLAIDYAKDAKKALAASRQAARFKLVSYVDRDGDKTLRHIPPGRPAGENPEHVTNLALARNFLPMMQSGSYGSRADWVDALSLTNYDILVIDPFWRGSEALTAADIKALKLKQIGSRRLVIATLPVGHAEDTRYYWKKDWQVGSPPWLDAPDPAKPAQTMVHYWEAEWKAVIGQYMAGLLDIGVDGVLLDDVDAYLYYEDLMPLR